MITRLEHLILKKEWDIILIISITLYLNRHIFQVILGIDQRAWYSIWPVMFTLIAFDIWADPSVKPCQPMSQELSDKLVGGKDGCHVHFVCAMQITLSLQCWWHKAEGVCKLLNQAQKGTYIMINQYNILTLRWSLSLAKSVYLKCLGFFKKERQWERERMWVREKVR